MPTKIVRYTACLIFFLLMLGSIDESTVWTSFSFLTGFIMTFDEKTICEYFKVKNYWLFYAIWIFVVVMIMAITFYFRLKGHNL